IQEKNYNILRSAIENIEGVQMRTVPMGGVENYSFLSFFMPDAQSAKEVHGKLGENGVDGCFYWFDNNWHYIKKWDHLKDLKSLGKLPEELRQSLPDYNQMDTSQSDHWLGRTISVLIKLGWNVEEVKERAKRMVDTINSVSVEVTG